MDKSDHEVWARKTIPQRNPIHTICNTEKLVFLVVFIARNGTLEVYAEVHVTTLKDK
jgi:hypothetical protein